MQSHRTLAAWLLICAASCSAVRAGTLAGYTQHVWQASAGLPEQTVQAFAQTGDGYLWIGTTGGLVRFDGAHFTVFDRQNTPSLHENSVFCLMVSRDGALWIGTEGGGLTRFSQGQFRSWTTREGLSNDFVRSLAEDGLGTIWAGTDNGLLRLDRDRFVRVDGVSGIPGLAVHSVYPDRAGRLWVGGSKLLCLQGANATEYTLSGEASQNRVKSILQTQDGTLWVGTVSGLNRMPPGHDKFERVPGITGTVRVLRQTPDGVLWIGTIGQGAFQYNAGKLTQITAPSALPSNTVLNFFEDSEKNLWIGTQTGMLRLTKAQVVIVPLPKANDADFGTIYMDRDGSFWIGSTLLFQMKEGAAVPQNLPGLNGIHVRNVYRDRAGSLWVGTDGDGVFHISANRTTHLTTRDGLSNNFVRALAQDRDGSIWVAADEGISHILPGGAAPRLVSYQMADGLAYFSTRVLLEDRHGDLWIGTDRGLSHMHAGAFINDAATSALTQMKIWAIHEDADGGLWFGTRNNGLFRFRDGKLAHFSAQDGLAGNAIYQILEDGSGHLWMSGPNGISMLNRSELDAQAESSPRHFALAFYSTSDMAANIEIYGGTQPSGCITAQGDVWFPSSLGPIHVLPYQLSVLPPPPVRIQTVLADGVTAAMRDPIKLQPGLSRLEFVFTPIQMSSQEGLRFSYLLDGFEKDWSPDTPARTADYTNLPAGRYRFRVRAFQIGNPGELTEASIQVVQLPFFYRTWWFITVCTLLFVLVIYGVYQNRVRSVRARADAVLEERSRLAREMHDTVIQGCTGVSALLEALSMEDAAGSDGSGLMDFARLQLRNTIGEAREAIWNLHQPDGDAGSLGAKLESMTRMVGSEFRVPVAWSMSGTPFAVSHPVAHDLLMVAREAVSNAVRHGHPAHVQVSLAYKTSELILSFADDGCGFGAGQSEILSDRHFGIMGMRERVERWGGEFQLTSAIGKGVRIEVRLPRNRRQTARTRNAGTRKDDAVQTNRPGPSLSKTS
jgi:ligand-binding sensor domain-containing protein/signal transduction histidine kinase